MFSRLPVGPAIRWLEAMTSDQPAVLLDLAERRIKEQGHRDAIAAIRRARGLPLDDQAKACLERVSAAITKAAQPRARTYLEAITAGKDNSWVDGFLAFRAEFELADAASTAMDAYNALRDQHDPPAAKLLGEARGLFQQGQREAGFARAQEIVDKYYASSSYRLASKWLAERKQE